MQNITVVYLSLILSLISISGLRAQDTIPRPAEKEIIAPDLTPDIDSALVFPDSLLVLDSLPKTDTTKAVPKGDIQNPINYYAEDSIVSNFKEQKVYLYRGAWFEYGNIRLEADYIEINWDKSELYASGLEDSTGTVTGSPLFQEGGTSYEIRKQMRYNFESRKAIITDVVTEQQEGLLRGQTVKKDEEGNVYLHKGYYTTCNLEQPHWHISSNKIKSVKGNQTISGPFNLYFNGIPTPIGLPFGFIPDQPEEKASGIIIPSYGEERRRGFFLRDFGYYFAFNDYIHSRLTGEIFSKGGYGVKLSTVYKKRYRFNGGFNIDFQQFRSPETEETPLDYTTLWVNWSHSPESRGNSRFSASVNAGTTNYNNLVVNPTNYMRNTNSEFTSNISYSKTFTGTPFSMSANLRHSQNVQTDEVRLVLPDISVNMNRRTPFRNVGFEPLKTLNFAWNFNAQNTINNRVEQELGVENEFLQEDQFADTRNPEVTTFNLQNLPKLLKEAENGFRHSLPVSSNFTLFKYFTGTAGFQYTELWYFDKINYYYNPTEERVDRILEDGFTRAGYYNSSFNMSTNIYGFYSFKEGSKVEAIRHHLQPTFGFSYTPDFSDPKYGYYQNVQVDNEGNQQLYSRFQGQLFGGPPRGESRSLNINIRNTLEAKVKTKSDTAETTTKKVPILQSLNISTNYNFAADSFNLAPINMNTRTSFFDNRFSVAMSATLDPYATRTTINPETGSETINRINEFAWNQGQGLGTLRRANLNLNGSIRPGSTEKTPADTREELTNEYLEQGGEMNEFAESEIDRMANDPSQYIDWDIPWNLNFGYNLSYSKSTRGNTNITQAVNVSGDLSLSEKWKINFNTGFDISTAKITQSMIGIARDLHCWQMNASWIPFGRFTSYNIDIRVKASILQDLKISRRRSFFDSF
ncbi:putative LPS assembly protein LptD [Echinicola jeungdonensis]|uniref:LPS assembly protein LptD n=1 Tax=Echinicola jeungdonensis TaxID=709343 RepID=A0ABV5J0V4_9BACT|nr:putative LPS assembly protein LptD [Echinicola jeungdonensis]MDN3668281.1 putative LPS assembly protein LptD [Echinicola jeungdonensis]